MSRVRDTLAGPATIISGWRRFRLAKTSKRPPRDFFSPIKSRPQNPPLCRVGQSNRGQVCPETKTVYVQFNFKNSAMEIKKKFFFSLNKLKKSITN